MFLNGLQYSDNEGELLNSVYLKKRQTFQYLCYLSEYALEHKTGVTRMLTYRAHIICSNRRGEEQRKRKTGKTIHNCGYPNCIINEGLTRSEDKDRKNDNTTNKDWHTYTSMTLILCLKGLRDKIRRIIKKHLYCLQAILVTTVTTLMIYYIVCLSGWISLFDIYIAQF